MQKIKFFFLFQHIHLHCSWHKNMHALPQKIMLFRFLHNKLKLFPLFNFNLNNNCDDDLCDNILHKKQNIMQPKETKKPNKSARIITKNNATILPFTYSDSTIKINLTLVSEQEQQQKKVKGYKYLQV